MTPTPPAADRPAETGGREGLAAALWAQFGYPVDLEWEELPSDVREGWREDADAILASDWLRDHDAAVRAEAKREVGEAVLTLLPGLRVANYVERWATGSPAVQALSALSEFVGEGPVAAGETVDPDVLSAHTRRPAGDPTPGGTP